MYQLGGTFRNVHQIATMYTLNIIQFWQLRLDKLKLKRVQALS